MYWRLAAAVALSSFAAIVWVASGVSALMAHVVARRITERAQTSRADGLLALRLLPAMAGLVGAFGIVLPIFLWFEPSDTQEPLAKTLAAAGALGVVWLAHGIRRAVLAWRATRTLARAWRVRGRRLDIADTPLPVFAIDEAYPIVVVVGLRRPAVFISERVLHSCSPHEVRAMILHECAHVAARDNITRFALRACPTLFPANRRLETLWTHASEEAADAAAAGLSPRLRTDLANALVTVARLATVTPPPLPASALYLGGSIESRVRRLLGPAEAHRSSRVRMLAASLAVVTATVAAAVVFGPTLHDAIEVIIGALP
jgi:hypothetical protein